MIGISSFAFHTFSNSFTGSLDVLAIIIFMLIYLTKIYKNLLGLNILNSLTVAILVIFICVFSGFALRKTILGASSFYFPILLQLLFLNVYFNLKKFQQHYLKYFYYATLLFFISLTLRTLDKEICSLFPIGTHFLWHVLNAIFLFYIVKFYVYAETDPPQKNQPKPIANSELP